MTTSLSETRFVHYYRQILLPEVGESGQQTLLQSHVLIVGVGGLGTHVAQQLAAAGVGHIYLMDNDKVERSNLPRQVLFAAPDIGQNKVDIAKRQIHQHNPDVHVVAWPWHFDLDSVAIFIQQQPLLSAALHQQNLTVLDCSDNLTTRHSVNLWCVEHKLVLVSAAVSAFCGQLLLVDLQNAQHAGCYRCLFDERAITQDCQTMGVLGPTVAVVASMQAALTLKHILTVGAADDHLHVYDGYTLSWRKLKRQRDRHCPVCCTPPTLNSPITHQREASL